MCTDEIEARFTMNDPNGSSFPINTHSPLHFFCTLILNSLSWGLCSSYLRI
ncbi:hypothetical protein HanPSC8_Chr10g0441281 [Helianthus annuus]|nr:hypothetical protein HanIR_Chr16g0812941 [Helianthus annuus]KAJ0885082.1 hypothetical protein HanPSC8_Chr10g0441281 [Helianthus annuus]